MYTIPDVVWKFTLHRQTKLLFTLKFIMLPQWKQLAIRIKQVLHIFCIEMLGHTDICTLLVYIHVHKFITQLFGYLSLQSNCIHDNTSVQDLSKTSDQANSMILAQKQKKHQQICSPLLIQYHALQFSGRGSFLSQQQQHWENDNNNKTILYHWKV